MADNYASKQVSHHENSKQIAVFSDMSRVVSEKSCKVSMAVSAKGGAA